MARDQKIGIAVLASGRGSNLQAIIDAADSGKLNAAVTVVVSDRAEAYALERARRHRTPAHHIDPQAHATREGFETAVIDTLEKYQVDLVCLAGFMRLLSPSFVRRYPGRIMNIHPALLPAFPGLHAQHKALEHGVKIAGCTVHFVDEGVDTGPIIIQAAVPVLDGDTEETLSARILEFEHQIYPRAIQLFAEGRLTLEGRRVRCSSSATKPAATTVNGWYHP